MNAAASRPLRQPRCHPRRCGDGHFGDEHCLASPIRISGYFNPLASGAASGGDIAIWAFNFVLHRQQDARACSRMLFGASTLLVMERAAASGRNPARKPLCAHGLAVHVFGLIHYYLIWFGDILTLYAACGLLLYFFRDLSIRALLWWALGFAADFNGSISWPILGLFRPVSEAATVARPKCRRT